MKHTFELFEKFADGSSLWRDSASGLTTARLRMQELAMRSQNQFYAINLATGEAFPCRAMGRGQRPHAPSSTRRLGKSQAA